MIARVPAGLRAWLGAAHPFPITAVLSLTALIGLASADGLPRPGLLAVALVAMLLSQLAIGWTNDYVDRTTDAVHQPSKPIPSGQLDAERVAIAAGAAAVVSLALAAVLGPEPLAFFGVGTIAGLAYDAWLKDSRFSWLPYLVAFAVLPPFVWTALDVFREEFLWLYFVASPLVIAVHISNSLPDVESDRRAGRAGLVARLGRATAVRLLALCLFAPLALVATTLTWVDYEPLNLVMTIAAYVAPAVMALAVFACDGNRSGASAGFRWVAGAGVVFATGWLASV